MNRIWITGFSQFELGIFNAKDPRVTIIKYAITKFLTHALTDTDEPYWLLTGGQSGIEQWSVEAALALQGQYPQLKIAIMKPYEHYGSKWKTERQTALHDLESRVDFVAATSNQDYQNPGQLQNYQNFMLTHTDEAMLFYDDMADQSNVRYTYKAIQAFQNRQDNYHLLMIDFDRLQDYAEEYAENLAN